jgi:hypothetical protein
MGKKLWQISAKNELFPYLSVTFTNRRTLARYLNASTVLLTRSLSVVAKKRFPTVDHLVDAGLLTKEELGMYNDVQLQYGKFWVPLIWFTKMLDRAKEEGQLKDPTGMASKQLMDELMAFRTLLGKMFMYDWVSIPVSYTQVQLQPNRRNFFFKFFLEFFNFSGGYSCDVFIFFWMPILSATTRPISGLQGPHI